MPIIMEGSMIHCSIGKFISNYTNVGFNFAKVDGSILFFNHGDDCSKSLICVCFRCN